MKARISAVHQLEMETQWIHTDEYDEMVIPVDSIPADLSSLDVLLGLHAGPMQAKTVTL